MLCCAGWVRGSLGDPIFLAPFFFCGGVADSLYSHRKTSIFAMFSFFYRKTLFSLYSNSKNFYFHLIFFLL